MALSWRLEHEEVIDEVEALGLLIRETDSSLLAFALYRGVAEREAAVRALKERLDLPVLEFALSQRQKDPIALLGEVPDTARACVLFYDVEAALPDIAGYLNLQREAFGRVPHATVFWAGEHGLRELATNAPDFWAWRSGVFDFRSEQFERPAAAMRAALGEPVSFQDRGDLERRIGLYKGLIQEHGGQEKPDERFLARLELRLASACFTLGRLEEARSHALQALEHGPRSDDAGAEADALYVLGNVAIESGHIDEAERHAKKVLAFRRRSDDEAAVAFSYHQIGAVAQHRQRLDEAEEWFRKALTVLERLGLERSAATEFHHLGVIAQERQWLEEAEGWYRKGLEIFERLGLERDAADEYHQLGTIAEERLRLDEAEGWYRKALEIFERLGPEPAAADEYHELGVIAHKRHQLDEAENWYRRALTIRERLGPERDAARVYHELGILARDRQRLDEAESWYGRALEIFDRLGHRPLLVDTLAELGLLRRGQGNPGEAVSWFGKALAVAVEYNMRVEGQILSDLARTMKDMGEEEFTEAWRQAFDGQEPPLAAILGVLGRPEAADPPEPGDDA